MAGARCSVCHTTGPVNCQGMETLDAPISTLNGAAIPVAQILWIMLALAVCVAAGAGVVAVAVEIYSPEGRRRASRCLGEAPAATLAPDYGTALAKSKQPGHKSSCSWQAIGRACQPIANGFNMLVGAGILCYPYAFEKAGWLAGLFLLTSITLSANFAAKILGKIMDSDHELRSYSDIGRKAFGWAGDVGIGMIVCLDLVGIAIAVMILSGDTLHSLFPVYSAAFWTCISMMIMVPQVVITDMDLFAYASGVGATGTLLVVLMCCLWAFLPVVRTDMDLTQIDMSQLQSSPAMSHNLDNIAFSVGIFMFGYSGMAAFPEIKLALESRGAQSFGGTDSESSDGSEGDSQESGNAAAMTDTSSDCMTYADSCNVTFLATFLCYTLVGMLGFLMFNGREPGIEEELTENLIIDARLYHTWFSKLPSFVLGAVVITQMSRCELQLAGRPCFSSPCNCFVTANLLTNGSQHLIVDGLILNPVALRLEKIFLGHDDAAQSCNVINGAHGWRCCVSRLRGAVRSARLRCHTFQL